MRRAREPSYDRRVRFVGVLVALVLIAVALAAREDDEPAKPVLQNTAPTSVPQNAAPPSEKAIEDCRDACEQRAILEQLGDAPLRACRDSCGAIKPRAYEPIRKITVAPADHRR